MPTLDAISRGWLILSAAFLIKHLLADFILQTRWMVEGKERAEGWLPPLAAHTAIHGLGTAALASLFAPALVWLGAVDAATHFAIDRAKGTANRRLNLTPDKTGFWWLLGLDQTLHHATHLVFTALMIAAGAAPG